MSHLPSANIQLLYQATRVPIIEDFVGTVDGSGIIGTIGVWNCLKDCEKLSTDLKTNKTLHK